MVVTRLGNQVDNDCSTKKKKKKKSKKKKKENLIFYIEFHTERLLSFDQVA